jgi:hypothetical protein
MRDVNQKFVFAIQKFVFAIKCRARVKSCRRIGHWGAADSPEPGYPSKLGLGVRAVGDGLFANSSPRERVVLSHCRRLVAGTGPPSLRAGPRDHDHRPALRLGGSEARRLGTLADRADRGGASRPLPPLRALGLPQPARRGALALPGDACSLCRSSAGCAGKARPGGGCGPTPGRIVTQRRESPRSRVPEWNCSGGEPPWCGVVSIAKDRRGQTGRRRPSPAGSARHRLSRAADGTL